MSLAKVGGYLLCLPKKKCEFQQYRSFYDFFVVRYLRKLKLKFCAEPNTAFSESAPYLRHSIILGQRNCIKIEEKKLCQTYLKAKKNLDDNKQEPE